MLCSAHTLNTHLAFAIELAEAAEAEIMPRFRNVASSQKADGSEVTEADRQGERVMRERINARYPDHDILGEEHGEAGRTDARYQRYQWVLDPVDGTAGFTMGVPLFGTLVGLLKDGDPIVGVIHMPALGETVFAARGLGCWFRSPDTEPRRVRVDPVHQLSDAVVSAGGAHSLQMDPSDAPNPAIWSLMQRAGKFRFVPDCYQHTLLCRGSLHAAVEPLMFPWDIAALVPCVEEAGGVVTTVSGARQGIAFGDSLVTSTHPQLHDEVLALLQTAQQAARQPA